MLLCHVAQSSAHPLVPLADIVTEPLPTPAIHLNDIVINGEQASVWQASTGEQVVHVGGDVRIRVGERRLSAETVIVWLRESRFRTREFRQLDIFLYGNARIVELSGTVNEGPVLLATIATSGDVSLQCDDIERDDLSDTRLYADGVNLRNTIRAGFEGGDDEPPPILVRRKQTVKAPAPETTYRADKRISFEPLGDGKFRATSIGNMTLVRTSFDGSPTLEILADAGVVYGTLQSSTSMDANQGNSGSADLGAMAGQNIESVYLEGDVQLSYGDRHVRASRLYYDLVLDRALILDAVLFAQIPDRKLPIYVRADQIRQLSASEYEMENAVLTTSEFHTPHYHVGADKIQVVDRTPRGIAGQSTGLARASYKMTGVDFRLGGTPVAYWPSSSGKFRVSDTALRGISVSNDDNFGFTVETAWDLFNILSLEAPQGTTAELELDFFGDRGPAGGIEAEYLRENSFGLVRGYYVHDEGNDNLGRFRQNEPPRSTRGRFTFRHREYLPDDWQLTLEGSYISDRGFLEEYFENEFDLDKDQETLFFAKKQSDNWAFTAHGQVRVNDFFTRTERLPEFAFRLTGEPVGNFGVRHSEVRAGVVRYRAAEKDIYLLLRQGSDEPSSGATIRGDGRQEVEFPFTIGPVKMVPFASVRTTGWDDSPVSGGLTRFFGTAGVRSSLYLQKVYPDIVSSAFDIHGLRHIIKFDAMGWTAVGNRRSTDLYPFDPDVEQLDDFSGATFGVRQRLQTKRGPVNERQVVDWITLDVEVGAFNNATNATFTNGFTSFTRPENSLARNYVNTSLVYNVNDSTAVVSEMNYDMNDGEIDVFDLSVAVDRTPRFSYLVGYRYIEESNSNLLGIALNYQIDRKHAIALREEFDIGRGETLDFTIAYIRKYPRWYVALAFELDEAENNAGVSLSIWPEGVPKASIGSRRFTGLATTTAFSPR